MTESRATCLRRGFGRQARGTIAILRSGAAVSKKMLPDFVPVENWRAALKKYKICLYGKV